jgi:peroxiredoxin
MSHSTNNPETWLLEQTASRSFTVLVFFRGSWCPFCQAYLTEMNGEFLDEIRHAGGDLVAITSQSDIPAQQAHHEWGLKYNVVSEPQNILAQRFHIAITPKAQTPLAQDANEYPKGMAQPAVLALDKHGKVLFQWVIAPDEMNLGGASDRPLPMAIWKVIHAALSGETRTLADNQLLNPAFLEAHYPEQYATFQAWVAQSQNRS